MDKIIKSVLQKIEDNGFSAYVVGGYVRDYLLGIKSNDIDICTNALPKDLHKLFPNNTNSNNYGGFNLVIKKYNIDITTFRKELSYDKRKPTEIIYINSLEEDILRRDFTINSICLNKEDKIIDLVNGVEDLNNRKIKMLGDVPQKLQDDPLRILRAIRFASILGFEIDNELSNAILDNYELVKTLSKMRIKQELTKILLNKNYLKGLNLLKKYKILDILNIEYDENMIYVNDICGMWAQLKIKEDYGFTKQEKLNIINISKIIEKGIIDNEVLFKYDLYCSLVAGEILGINKKIIMKKANSLPIKSEKDLQISNEEIINLLDIEPSKKIKDIKNELIMQILNNKLRNRNSELKKYILNRKEM